MQKFVGSQLRSRTYTVNLSDISSIPPWKFVEEDLSDDEDSVHYYDPSSISTHEDRDLPNQDQELHTNEVRIGGDQNPNQERNTITRSGRSVRSPSRFGDYVM